MVTVLQAESCTTIYLECALRMYKSGHISVDVRGERAAARHKTCSQMRLSALGGVTFSDLIYLQYVYVIIY